MTQIITNDCGQKYQTAKALKTTGAIAGSYALNIGIKEAGRGLNKKIINNLKTIPSKVDLSNIQPATTNILSDINKNITPRTVKIKNFSNLSLEEFDKSIANVKSQMFTKLKGDSSIPEKIKCLIFSNKKIKGIKNLKSIVAGNNACFASKNNEVLINLNKCGYAVFHEIGHSINYNANNFLTRLQKYRKFARLTPTTCLLVSLFKRPKTENEKPKGFVDKVTTFIKNNAGKITFLSMTPVIAEEFIATAKGNKLAKQYVPELYKTVRKANAIAGSTYVISAITASLAISGANKLRDFITKPKKVQ